MKLEALAPLHLRQGWVKSSNDEITVARKAAVNSPVYHKIAALAGFKDTSSKKQIENGTINFYIHGASYVQCTSTLICRFQGPTDFNARKLDVPDSLQELPLADAYIEMLNVIYERFKGFANKVMDITAATGFKAGSVNLSLKHRGITTLAGLKGRFERVDVSANNIANLGCSAAIRYLVAAYNPITSLEGLPAYDYLDLSGNTALINWAEEYKHLAVTKLLVSNENSKRLSMLLLCPTLKKLTLKFDKTSKIDNLQRAKAQNWVDAVIAATDRRKAMLKFQQDVIEADLDEIINL